MIPKVELHVHLEGAIPHKALFDLIEKYGGDPTVPDAGVLAKRFEYKNFPQFIDTWNWKNGFLREYEDFTHISELWAREMAEQNIRYAEVFFSPSPFVRVGLETGKLIAAVRKGIDSVPEMKASIIVDLVRDFGPEAETRILRELKDVREMGVIGIGIGGSEQDYPPELFEFLFEEARGMGFRTCAHAGEAAGPESVRAAVDILKVDRIGHGTRAAEDPRLVEYISSKGVPIDLCPVSNLRTGVIPRLEDHPVREYLDRGIIVSINSDDPKMFNTSLAHEYRMLEEKLGFSKKEIARLVLLGIRASWLPEEQKESLTEEFKNHPEWPS